MKNNKTHLFTRVRIKSKNGERKTDFFSKMPKYLYGSFSLYTLAEYYIEYIKALYENS